MLPSGCWFSDMSWWAVPISSKPKVLDRQGSTRPSITSRLNAADCSSLAKWEPWNRFCRIHRYLRSATAL